jgi:tRNA(Ile)-lysidine synthetase-like protein
VAIFLAHHADDQAETVLLRALKGSGVAGLRGMARRRGLLVRPLLGVPRAALAAYAAERGYEPWDDPANADRRHLRSWLRCEVLPAVRERIPQVDRHLRRTARDAARDARAWDRVLDLLPALDLRREPDGHSVAAAPLGAYDSALAATVVRAVVRRAGGVVGPRHAGRAAALAASGESGRWVQLGGGWMAELAFGRLHLRRWTALPSPGPLVMAGATGELDWGPWRIRWRTAPVPERQARGGFTAWFPAGAFRVRPWRRGDRIRPLGGAGSRLAVRCFQDAHVPASRRAHWPVFEADDRVLWIPGVCRGDDLIPPAGTEALRVDAHFA